MGAMLGLRPGLRLLDVGAGSGWPGIYMAERSGCDLALMDLPLTGLQIAARRANRDQIESTFGTIRHRTSRSKRCLTRDGMLHMMFKLGICAETNWRKLRGFDYLAKVIKGVEFKDGIEVKSDDQIAA